MPLEKSEVFKQLVSTKQYAETNEMKLNFKKTKLMIFNNGKNMDFMPEMSIDGNELEVVEEMRVEDSWGQ